DGRRLTPGTRSGTRGRDSPDPKPCGKTAGAAKAVDGYENPLGRKAREGSSPSARTKSPLPARKARRGMGHFDEMPTSGQIGTPDPGAFLRTNVRRWLGTLAR